MTVIALNYNKVALLPPLVRAFCYNNDAWIVGTAALYLLDQVESFNDYDILIPFWTWGDACRACPCGSLTNSHGGIKLKIDEYKTCDIWAGDIGWFLAQVPLCPSFAVHIKSQRFIRVDNDINRTKKTGSDK